MKSLWKQDQELDPTFQLIQSCLAEDWFLLPHELDLQKAHAATLHDAKILSLEEREALEQAIESIGEEWIGKGPPDSGCEDLHTWIEAELTARAGDAGKKIHTARSRNDQIATLLKLYVRDRGARLEEAVSRLTACFCRKAKEWADLEFPLQTHTQFAAPGTVGFWGLRYATALDRVRGQLAGWGPEWARECPLGAGAVAGSSIPIDRSTQARLLGFAEPSGNALDSTSTRDECLDLLAVAVKLALHLQSFATDGIAFAQTPFSWVRYPAAFATGSSMMPNKSNPDALELLRGECNRVHGAHAQVVCLLKGLPSGYNRDLQCLKPVLREAVERMLLLVEMTGRFVEELEFLEENVSPSLSRGEIQATLRMERRVLSGCTLREAHHLEADGGGSGGNEAGLGARSYRTAGGSHPDEVRRVADAILARQPDAAPC